MLNFSKSTLRKNRVQIHARKHLFKTHEIILPLQYPPTKPSPTVLRYSYQTHTLYLLAAFWSFLVASRALMALMGSSDFFPGSFPPPRCIFFNHIGSYFSWTTSSPSFCHSWRKHASITEVIPFFIPLIISSAWAQQTIRFFDWLHIFDAGERLACVRIRTRHHDGILDLVPKIFSIYLSYLGPPRLPFCIYRLVGSIDISVFVVAEGTASVGGDIIVSVWQSSLLLLLCFLSLLILSSLLRLLSLFYFS